MKEVFPEGFYLFISLSLSLSSEGSWGSWTPQRWKAAFIQVRSRVRNKNTVKNEQKHNRHIEIDRYII